MARTVAWVGILAMCVVRASAASPGVYPPNCTVPNTIALVGSHASVPDAVGRFTVVVRDIANNPRNGASVVIDLSPCPDVLVCADQLDASATVNCAAKTVRKFTDVMGSVSFTILGGSNGSGNATTLLHGVRIFANGLQIGSPTAACYDLGGQNGLNINDLSVWLADYGTPGNPTFGRSDFDGDGAIGINDLSRWLTAYGADGSETGCAASCP